MAIDTSIYSQVGKGGNLGDLVNSYAAGRQANIQGRLSDLQLSEAERNAAQGKAVSQAYSGNIGADGTINRTGMINQLASSGQGGAIPGLQKSWADQDKAATEASAKKLEMAKKQLDYFNGSMSGLLALPEITDDALIRATSDAVNRGFLGQDQAIAFVRGMPADQKARRAMLMSGVMQSTDAAKQLEALLPKVQAQNLGGRTLMVDVNPMTNPAVVGQSMERTATPGEVEQQRHNLAAEGSAAQKASRDQTQIVTDADGGVQLVNKQTGQAQPVTGADGQPVIGKGGLSQEQLKNASSKQQTVTILRKQLENLKAARDKLGTMDYGVVAGRQAVTDSARAYDGALAALQSTVRQLTRTPGEGSMSDYESRIAQAQLPGRVDPAQVIDQKITQLEDLANVIEQGYSSILSKAKGGRQQPAPAGSGGGVLMPAQQPQGSAVIEQARQAIASGADPAAVRQRLQSMGIDPRGLGNGNDSRTGSW
ncbi:MULTISPECIES: hypothetical protein [Comamonas]|uniref:hypothetical protein n=1 Tax=Comamonas TaxID=283 RepID=UPI0001DA646B|nr:MULTISPECIES: hypothetical protein [Comamonas]EFI58753.1 hypothetical protein CTS44_25771 [Comamonas thiooxydans]TFF62575.1 hypothetical protein EIC84_00360 [Comamonas sp. A23]